MQEPAEIQEQIWQSFINPSVDVDTNWQGVIQTNKDVSLRVSYINIGKKKLKYLKCEKNTPHLIGYRELVHLMNMCFNTSKNKRTYKQYLEEVSRKKGPENLVVTIVPITSEKELKSKDRNLGSGPDKIL
jgi:hypothetical protein